MSNASNLSTLANVLDDGSDGQFLKSTGSGGVAFDTVAAGAVVYATADLLPLSGFAAGDMAYVTATNRFYINNGSGWYSISLVNTNPNITSVADASSGTTPFTLATDQTATVITITAADPEEVPLTYGYSVTSGSLNGSTVAQGTGSNTNVFTVTPHASQEATFTITFTASDGINQATSANAFSLSFVTIVADSNHTTLLATATGTSDNNNITDSSSNSHSITVNGDAYAGTFSPYRSGGYSTYFDGSGDNLDISASSDFDFGTGDFTFEMSFYAEATSGGAKYLITNRASGWGSGVFQFTISAAATATYCTFYGYDLGGYSIVPETWYHISAVKSGDIITLYLNGATPTAGGGHSQSHSGVNNVSMGSSSKAVDIGSNGTADYFKGYIRDLRIVKGTAITPPSGGPTERLEAVTNTSLLTCHLPYIADGSTNDHSITVNGDTSTKPFSPYDYEEYSAADHGGSVYFVGGANYSSQYLSLSGPSMPSGDFTLSTWAYLTSYGSDTTLIDLNGNSGGFRILYTSNSTGGYHFRFYTAGATVYLYDQNIDQPLNQWHYIVVVRDSGTFKLYVNNKLINTSTATPTFSSSTNVRIGQALGGFGTVEGYLSDIIYNPTTAITDFTPPTAPLSSSGTSLHIKGTDASIIDKSQGSNLKLIGNTTGSTTQVKFSNTKSMYFDGNGDHIEIDGPFNLGTQPWTWEAWIYTGDNSYTLVNIGESASTGFSIEKAGSSYYVYDLAANTYYSVSNVAANNTWTHLAFCRQSNGNHDFYKDGSRISNYTSWNSKNWGSLAKLKIGEYWTTNQSDFSGYLQDVRLTVGKSRYTASDETANIPTAPLEG